MTEDFSRPSVFRSIFGDQWDALPPVMKLHYANRPFTNDLVTVKGRMEVRLHWLVKLFAPLFNFSKTLVAKEGDDIAVTVHFKSEPDSNMFCFDRTFTFPDGSVYTFFSRMEPVGGSELIEWTASGIGWRVNYGFDGSNVFLHHRGYCIRLFGKRIPLLVSLIFGKASALEKAKSNTEFAMTMNIQHPLFGQLYFYGGQFEITEVKLDG